MNELAEAAIEYARKGYSVLPLRPKSKRPSAPWAKAQKQAATPDEVAALWNSNGKAAANIAIATGLVSGCFVVDLDGPEGEAQFEWRVFDNPPPRSRTGTGGHLWFLLPPGLIIPNAVRILPGVDIRAEGGYVVVPPSIHPSGARYSWELGAIPAISSMPLPPQWLLDLILGHLNDAQENTPETEPERPTGRLKLSRATTRFVEHGAGEGERNDMLFRAACDFAGCRYTQAEAEAALLRPGRTSGLPSPEIKRAIASAFQKPRTPTIPDAPPQAQPRKQTPGAATDSTTPAEPTPLPEIIVTPNITRVVDQAIELLKEDPALYQRAGMLVRVIRTATTARSIQRSPDAPIIVEADDDWVRERMRRLAVWKKYNAKLVLINVLPPEWVTATHRARKEWPYRTLVGVTNCPTLRHDGSILDTPGYDASTGLLYTPQRGMDAVSVPQQPTPADLATALETLCEPYCEFSWLDDQPGYSTIVAMILTILCRHIVTGPVPMLGITAPTRGSGKTILADSIAVIATGNRAACMPPADHAEEDRKRLLSIAGAGDPVVLIDNLDREFRSAIWAAAITSESVRDRVLGETRMVTVPWLATLVATGNNLVIRGDLSRRALMLRLDPQTEYPEDRTGWRHNDLLSYVQEQRPALVSAALTLMRGWFDAGRPQPKVTAWGSFEAWSSTIRAAVTWALSDPVTETSRPRDEDPERDELGELLTILSEHCPNAETAKSTAELVKYSESNGDLLAALAGVCGGEKKLSAKALAYAFRSRKGRLVNGSALSSLKSTFGRNEPVKWYIENTGG